MKPSDLITKHDLNEFKKELIEALSSKIETCLADATLQKKWLRTAEVAEYLSLSNSQISSLKNEGIFQVRKIGGTNYYDREEIDNYLKNQEGNNVST